MSRTEWLSEKPSGRRAPLADDIDLARQGIYAGDLPSAAKNHTPHTNDFPRGWTVQQPWHHAEFPLPAAVRCTVCAQSHSAGSCEVVKVLVSLGGVGRP